MRNILLKSGNYALYLVTCALISAGAVLEYRLPSRGESRSLALLGMDRHDWGEAHFILGIAFVVLSIWHLYLNWSWIMKVANQGRLRMLVGSVAVGLALIVVPQIISVSQRHDAEIQRKGRHHGAESIIGGKRGWQREQELREEL